MTFDPRAMGLQIVEQLKGAEGGAFSDAEMNVQFGLGVIDLARRHKEFRLILWRDAQGNARYPKWQFAGGGTTLPGIEEILQTFQSYDEWRVMRYFLTPRHQLGGQTPLALLRTGKAEEVIAHAKRHAAQNTW